MTTGPPVSIPPRRDQYFPEKLDKPLCNFPGRAVTKKAAGEKMSATQRPMIRPNTKAIMISMTPLAITIKINAKRNEAKI